MTPQLILRDRISEIIQKAGIHELLSCIEKAYVSYSDHSAVVPPVGTLTFQDPPGDVHIKYGYIQGGDNYVIKIASGFYDNPVLGLPSSNGLNLVFDQKNGLLRTILLDEGHLTDVRTAVGGAVAAKYLAPPVVNKIGIVGTGIQARLQLIYISQVVDCRDVLVWGRSKEKLNAYKEDLKSSGFNIESTLDNSRITEECNLIVTATPSTSPILMGEKLQDGVLIVAMGADTKGKQELDFSVLKKADRIILDSYSQCQSHGEIHKSYAAGILKRHEMKELGEIIADQAFTRNPDDVIIADLTGIATQDIQISNFILSKI